MFNRIYLAIVLAITAYRAEGARLKWRRAEAMAIKAERRASKLKMIAANHQLKVVNLVAETEV